MYFIVEVVEANGLVYELDDESFCDVGAMILASDEPGISTQRFVVTPKCRPSSTLASQPSAASVLMALRDVAPSAKKSPSKKTVAKKTKKLLKKKKKAAQLQAALCAS